MSKLEDSLSREDRALLKRLNKEAMQIVAKEHRNN